MTSSTCRLTFLLIVGLVFHASAQTDSLQKTIVAENTENQGAPYRHSPKKAWLLSAAIPGAGQFYNRKYWKLPILYGGIAGIAYGIQFNNGEFQRFKNIIRDRADSIFTDEFNGIYNDAQIRIRRDYYRRNRDFMIIIASLVYMVQIIDAHVDAHLMEFDIGEKLTLNAEPVLMATFGQPATAGLQLTFNFR